MGRNRTMNEEDWKVILCDNLLQVPVEETAEKLGVTRFAVSCTFRMINAVKCDNWDAVVSLINQRQSQACLVWAAKTFKKEIPMHVVDAMKKATNDQTERRRAIVNDDHEAKSSEEINGLKLVLITIAEEQKKTNELLEQLYDVVIPKWTADVKDNVNVNSDLQNQILKRIEDKLEAIKINTRKRGL